VLRVLRTAGEGQDHHPQGDRLWRLGPAQDGARDRRARRAPDRAGGGGARGGQPDAARGHDGADDARPPSPFRHGGPAWVLVVPAQAHEQERRVDEPELPGACGASLRAGEGGAGVCPQRPQQPVAHAAGAQRERPAARRRGRGQRVCCAGGRPGGRRGAVARVRPPRTQTCRGPARR